LFPIYIEDKSAPSRLEKSFEAGKPREGKLLKIESHVSATIY